MVDETSVRQYSSAKPRTVIIVYDQPRVLVVRRYTRTVVRRVNPDEYREKFHQVLLDTATLLELTRRLNIEESMVRVSHRSSSLRSLRFALDHPTEIPVNEGRRRRDRRSTSEWDCTWTMKRSSIFFEINLLYFEYHEHLIRILMDRCSWIHAHTNTE